MIMIIVSQDLDLIFVLINTVYYIFKCFIDDLCCHYYMLTVPSRCLVSAELPGRVQQWQGQHDARGSGSRPNHPGKQDSRCAHMRQRNFPPQAAHTQHRPTQHRRHTWWWVRSSGKFWRQSCYHWLELREDQWRVPRQGSLPGYQTAWQPRFPRLLPDLGHDMFGARLDCSPGFSACDFYPPTLPVLRLFFAPICILRQRNRLSNLCYSTVEQNFSAAVTAGEAAQI